jgi:hypothetical protein
MAVLNYSKNSVVWASLDCSNAAVDPVATVDDEAKVLFELMDAVSAEEDARAVGGDEVVWENWAIAESVHLGWKNLFADLE